MKRNWLEWLILVGSVVSLLALVGYLAVESLRGDRPADIVVSASVEDARTTPIGWALPVTIRNAGGEAAAAVTIEATATIAGQQEQAEVVAELLGPGTETSLVVGFSAEPEGDVTFRLVGYESP